MANMTATIDAASAAPKNQVGDRSGVPVDNTGALQANLVAQAGASIGDIFSGVGKASAEANLGRLNTDLSDMATQAFVNQSPQLKSVQDGQEALNQGNQPGGALGLNIAAQAKIKEFKSLYPQYAEKADQAANSALGYVPSQQFAKEVNAPQVLRDTVIDDAVKKGIFISNPDGTINTSQTFDLAQKTYASAQAAASARQQFDNLEINQKTLDLKNSPRAQEYTSSNLNTATNQLVNGEAYKSLEGLTPEAKGAKLQMVYDKWESGYKVSMDKYYSTLGLSAGALKEQQDYRDNLLKGVKGSLNDIDAVHDASQYLSNNTEVQASIHFPAAMTLSKIYGSSLGPIVSDALVKDDKFSTAISNEMTTGLSGIQSGEVPTSRNGIPMSRGDKQTDTVHYVADVGSDPRTLQYTHPDQQPVRVAQTFGILGNLADKANNLTPEQDRTFNIVHQNLTGLANSPAKLESPDDIINAANLLSQPLYIQAVQTSQAKQYNPALAEQTAQATLKTFDNSLDLLGRSITANATGTLAPKLRVNPYTGEVQPSTSQPGVVGVSDSLIVQNQQRGKQTEVQTSVKKYNQIVDGYIKLKGSSPYKNMSDAAMRQMFNKEYLGIGGEETK